MNYDEILEVLKTFNSNELISIHNFYCDFYNLVDDMIYDLEEFFDMFDSCSKSAYEICWECRFINMCDYYVTFDGYNWISFNNIREHIYIENIADCAASNFDDFKEFFE